MKIKTILLLLALCVAVSANAQNDSSPKGQNTYLKGVAHFNKEDFKSAAKYFESAAKQGNSEGMFMLALCYSDGLGVPKDSQKFVYWFEQAAQHGEVVAQTGLGDMYAEGKHVAKNRQKAEYWYKKAADKGYEEAKKKLAEFYQNNTMSAAAKRAEADLKSRSAKPGNEVAMKLFEEAVKKEEKDIAYSKATYKSLADDGYAPAQYKLYQLDIDHSWLEEAAMGGHFEAIRLFCQFETEICRGDEQEATLYYAKLRDGKVEDARIPSFPQAKEYFQEVLDKIEAMELSLTYLTPDDANYFPHYEKVKKSEMAEYRKRMINEDLPELLNAHAGYIKSMLSHYNLLEKDIEDLLIQKKMVEEMYQLGSDYFIRSDYAEAVRWWRNAAELGYAKAQNALGVRYHLGEGVTQDYAEAVKWYRKAAEQGYDAAQNNLADCYENGEGVTQDYAEAVKWYRKAAEQGYDAAQTELGACYYLGNGVTQDYTEAAKWFRKAAEQGNADAQAFLGLCYLDGKGVTLDYTEAAKWFRKAAEQGVAVAQYALGGCYYTGKGVTQNNEEAKKWLRRAAAQGNEDAKESLKEWFGE